MITALLTVTQTAERLNCSTSHVRALMRAAEMHYQLHQRQRSADTIPPRLRPLIDIGFPRPIRLSKSGRMVRISADELDAWISEVIQESPSLTVGRSLTAGRRSKPAHPRP